MKLGDIMRIFPLTLLEDYSNGSRYYEDFSTYNFGRLFEWIKIKILNLESIN